MVKATKVGLKQQEEPAGMAAQCLLEMKPYLSSEGRNDLLFNPMMDLESVDNTISVPLVLKDQLPVGVLQVSGKLGMLN